MLQRKGPFSLAAVPSLPFLSVGLLLLILYLLFIVVTQKSTLSITTTTQPCHHPWASTNDSPYKENSPILAEQHDPALLTSRIPLPFGLNTTGHSLATRQIPPDSDNFYQIEICKGRQLQWLTRLTPSEVVSSTNERAKLAQDSKWQTDEQIRQNGWVLEDYGEAATFSEEWSELGVDGRGAKRYEWLHEKTWAYNDLIAKVGPDYSSSWLLAADINNPAKVAPGSAFLPDLRQVSDFYYLLWKRLHSESDSSSAPYPPRYLMHDSISNGLTMDIIDRVLGHDVAEWPGLQLFPDDDRYAALLGSPNGGGVAWFLAQHNGWFGVREVVRIVVYGSRSTSTMTHRLIFEIGDPIDSAGDRSVGVNKGRRLPDFM